MSFVDAIASGFRQYANFQGRATRSEYWWFQLFSILCYAALIALAISLRFPGLILVYFGLILPSLAVCVRRLHDTNRSGAWWFISFVPFVGGIILLIFMCEGSDSFDNRYGPQR
ncbi:MAG TPA: DUF805 domain-containing protein [Stackebrandtia sp.]|uniref:DUF805 domain-containing protein n=1 Tax=Stackebrandtia sp. TaxID=2023065 RepID=UPI002D735427|nr:DUF805 domain-containing protein [Stackebrandtia sp.]HZE38310.1 DUF805 domain-containing protein [Stackebrandtia sp.]